MRSTTTIHNAYWNNGIFLLPTFTHTQKNTSHLSKEPPTNHEHAEVRQVSSHPKHSSLKIFLMASQVYEGNDFRGLLTNFGPVQASSMTIWLVYHLRGRDISRVFLLSPPLLHIKVT